MVSSLIPRDYQIAAAQALWNQVHSRPDQNPLVVMATGLGKSLNIAMFVQQMLYAYPHVRIMVVTHVKELIEGNYRALMNLWPGAPAGIYSAGLGVRETRAQVTYAGIASVAKRPETFQRVDFLVIDEAHRISDNDSAMYVRFINGLKKKNPHLITIGFTATAFRMGMGMLTDGELFDVECFNIGHGESFVWAIENGYLMKLVPKHPGFQLDDSSIGIVAGDFDNKAASQAFKDQDILEQAVDTTIAFGEEQNRRSWLTFCQSIEDSELIADMFRYKGYPVEPVHSKRDDRDEVLKAFKEGKLRGVTNKDVLTTGFDHPGIDLISMLRLTRSPGLWVQMLGRGTRPVFAPGYDITTKEGRLNAILAGPKQSCLVLDFCGNSERLGPINYPTFPKRRNSSGSEDTPMRCCPQCATFIHISIKVCTECGYEFPAPEKVRPEPSEAELVKSRNQTIDLTKQPEPKQFEVFPVHRMICSHNIGKRGKRDTMRVDYFSGVRRFSTWVCFEHEIGSFPRRKAEEWWRDHCDSKSLAPTSVEKALSFSLDFVKPKFIKVWINTEYPEIVGYDFRGTCFELPPEVGGPPLQEPGPDPTLPPPAPSYQNYFGDDDIPF
jgi:DNA repair protein RadD